MREKLEGYGIDCEEELKKRNGVEIKLRKRNELVYKECDKLSRRSMRVEKCYETLVEELKVKICRDVIMNEKDEQLEAEDVRKEVDRDFFLHNR